MFNNVLYYTKGSGGNGVNTVYFVDSTGEVCTDTKGLAFRFSEPLCRRPRWRTIAVQLSYRLRG